MNGSQTIFRMREVIQRQHKALSPADGLAARPAKPLPFEVASSFGQEVSRVLAMSYLREQMRAWHNCQQVLVEIHGRLPEFSSSHLSRSASYETTRQSQTPVPPLPILRALGTMS